MRSFLFKLGAFNSYVLGMKSRELFAVYKRSRELTRDLVLLPTSDSSFPIF